jgi:hypothetical protein
MKDERPHALYRFFGLSGDLLYVGRTVDPGARWRKHVDGKPWWTEVGTVQVEHFLDLNEVSAAERTAIQTEYPRYNIQYARSRPTGDPVVVTAEEVAREVVALGMRDGSCPVGMVVSWNDRVRLDLYSWMSGYFGYEEASYSVADIDEVRYAQLMTAEERRAEGWSDRIKRIYAMDHLARFQTRWQHEHGQLSNEDLAQTNKMFSGAKS